MEQVNQKRIIVCYVYIYVHQHANHVIPPGVRKKF